MWHCPESRTPLMGSMHKLPCSVGTFCCLTETSVVHVIASISALPMLSCGEQHFEQSSCPYVSLTEWEKSPGFFLMENSLKKKKSICLDQGYARILLTLNPTNKNSEGAHQYLESYLI